MTTLWIRYALISLFLVLGVLLHVQQGWSSAWYLYLAALLLLATLFLFGTVWAAFIKLRKGKIKEAEQLLNQIKKPEWLIKRNRAYYHFVKGMIDLQHKDLAPGEVHLKKALDLGLRTGNDQALAALNLAHLCFMEQRFEESRAFLHHAKSAESNDLVIKQNIDKMEKALIFPYN
jgi:hypothetical protein